ncbi:MAG: aminoglycoside phosphotransferase family protein [Alphaproteobacteria bacterium]|nr:aminoglycoside phosphotransferase family protein [Alphaproteobacteria bacterium]
MTPVPLPFFDPPAAREAKPSFDLLPPEMRQKIEARLSGEIISGEVVYGSLSSSAGYVLTFDSGLKVFAKGSHPDEMSHGTLHIRQEIRAYEYVPVLKETSPRLYSWVSDNNEDGWTLGLWSFIAQDDSADFAQRVSGVMALVAQVHGAAVPEGIVPDARAHNYIGAFLADEKKWRRIEAEASIRAKFLNLFEDPAAAQAWLGRNIAALIALQADAAVRVFTQGLIHGDLRTDNILFDKDRSWLVDWPNACMGPRTFDLVMLFTHLESTGFGAAENFLPLYDAAAGTRFATSEIDEIATMAGSMAGYFADQAYRGVPEKLPRLRWMQKSLLCAQLQLLARLGRIESPPRFSGQRDI